MGIQNLKKHYDIDHIIQITEKGICIGSAYIHDIIVMNPDGTCVKKYSGSNEDLMRYQKKFDEDVQLFKTLFSSPDERINSIRVYTYDGANIIEKFCEKLGWPNTTHDGEIMYENKFSPDKATVVSWAKRSAEISIEAYTCRIDQLEKDLSECRKLKNDAKTNLQALNLMTNT